ncbi:MAG: DUF2922 domain-containing protein [Eubacteriaceae bacterium]|jgi:hypothetical protein
MAITRTLGMKFVCSDQKNRTLNLADYREDATDAEIKNAMQSVIEAAVLVRNGAKFSGIDSACKTVTTKTEVAVGE